MISALSRKHISKLIYNIPNIYSATESSSSPSLHHLEGAWLTAERELNAENPLCVDCKLVIEPLKRKKLLI